MGFKRPQVRLLSLGPNKNESYDTTGIATFVLFFLLKMPVAQGFWAMGHKRIISLCYSPTLISMLIRGVLTPCSAAEIHNEIFLKRIISLWEKSFIVKKNSFSVKNSPYYRLSSRGCFALMLHHNCNRPIFIFVFSM